nr:immunoglobulin light chain junction region [Macaca mulatta]
CQQHNSRPRTF